MFAPGAFVTAQGGRLDIAATARHDRHGAERKPLARAKGVEASTTGVPYGLARFCVRRRCVVRHAKTGKLTDQDNANAVNKAAANLFKNQDVAAVVNPLTPEGASALNRGPAPMFTTSSGPR